MSAADPDPGPPPPSIRVDVHEGERWRRTLAVTVPAAIVREERGRTAAALARRLKLPGYRRGRAPAAIVERQHGAAVMQETVERVVVQAYRTALADLGFQPLGRERIEHVDLRTDGDLAFRVSFDVLPQIELERLDGFVVERPQGRVDDQDVDAALQRLLEEHAVWLPAEDGGRPRDGDLVTVRILELVSRPDAGLEDPPEVARPLEDVGLPLGQKLQLRTATPHQGLYQVVVGAGDAIPVVEEAIRTLVVGEEGDFTLLVPVEPTDETRRERRLRITLQDRRVRELPELDDAFARSLGGFASVGALRSRVRGDLEEDATVRAEQILRARLLDRVVEANPFDVPLSLVEAYVESRTREAEGDVVCTGAEFHAEAERAVKRLLVLERIASMQGLEATPEEVDARVRALAEQGGASALPARSDLVESGRLPAIAREIVDAKAFAFLRSRSRIEVEGSPATERGPKPLT